MSLSGHILKHACLKHEWKQLGFDFKIVHQVDKVKSAPKTLKAYFLAVNKHILMP